MTPRPHGLDELAGVAAASTVPTILLPMQTAREVAAFALEMERRVALVDALAELVLDRVPVGTPLSRTGELVARVRGLMERETSQVGVPVSPAIPGWAGPAMLPLVLVPARREPGLHFVAVAGVDR